MAELRLVESGVILGLETSCDETAAAVIAGGKVLSSVIRSQVEVHAPYGGVVPELAARAHDAAVGEVVLQAMEVAGVAPSGVEAVAVTSGPGLPSALAVGVSSALGLAVGLQVPLIGVDHMEGHLFAGTLAGPIELPALVLLVSGGHSELIAVDRPGAYRRIAATRDDAAGEAFDKVARLLGLGFPGGPAIERAAAAGNRELVSFPRAVVKEGLDLSFSGLKTAVRRYVEANPAAAVADIAACFQEAAVDTLADRVARAIEAGSYSTLVVGGGAGANLRLRERLAGIASRYGLLAAIPPPALCTDNGAMIAAAGAWRLSEGAPAGYLLDVDPGRSLVR